MEKEKDLAFSNQDLEFHWSRVGPMLAVNLNLIFFL